MEWRSISLYGRSISVEWKIMKFALFTNSCASRQTDFPFDWTCILYYKKWEANLNGWNIWPEKLERLEHLQCHKTKKPAEGQLAMNVHQVGNLPSDGFHGKSFCQGGMWVFLFCYEESRVLMKIELIQTVFFWMDLSVLDFCWFDFLSDFINRIRGERQEGGALMRYFCCTLLSHTA